MIMSLSSLATTSKFQKKICFKTRAVGLININTKKCKFMKVVYGPIVEMTSQNALFFTFDKRFVLVPFTTILDISNGK